MIHGVLIQEQTTWYTMRVVRYVDRDWHHYCDRSHVNPLDTYHSFQRYTEAICDKRYAYLQDFNKTQTSLEVLEEKIKKSLEVSDHTFVGFGEPIIIYKDPKHGWDHDNDCWDGPHYYTDDFINKFKSSDKVTFFANAVCHTKLNRPLFYLNDMFYQSREIYETYEVCRNLLRKLEHKPNKQYSWELMCSNNIELYKMLKNHAVNSSTFSTCHALGITHWGPDVIAPSNKQSGGQTFTKAHNIRCSDLIDPSIYNESFYSCVVETVIPADNRISMFSEKQAKPIVARRPFIIVGTKDHLKTFRSLGFKTFSPVVDESYDDEPNMVKRFEMILDAMKKLSEEDPATVYDKLHDVMEHNYLHFYKHNWNAELQKAWLTPTLLSE